MRCESVRPKSASDDASESLTEGATDLGSKEVFHHGYANMFGNALVYATFLKERYSDVPFNIGLFSWPSDGQLIHYM